jgi:hypothetical protein
MFVAYINNPQVADAGVSSTPLKRVKIFVSRVFGKLRKNQRSSGNTSGVLVGDTTSGDDFGDIMSREEFVGDSSSGEEFVGDTSIGDDCLSGATTSGECVDTETSVQVSDKTEGKLFQPL